MSLADFSWLEKLVGAVVAIGAGFGIWRKSRSRDSVEETQDRVEERGLERLQAHADAADARADAADARAKAADERADAIGDVVNQTSRELALVKAELDHQRRRNDKLHRSLIRMAEGLPPELRAAWEQALETDFAPLGGPETKP